MKIYDRYEDLLFEDNSITMKETVENAVRKGVSLLRANLSNTNLQDVNLECVDLYNASLYNADLQGANLEDADLKGAHLVNNYILIKKREYEQLKRSK